jgi:transposase-like protein
MDLARLEKKFQTFDKNLPTEEICRKKLYRWRWKKGFKCPECGAFGKSAMYFHRNRNLYQCKECGRQTSLTAGTIFHRTRVQLRTWLLMIYLMMLKPDNMRMDETRKTLGLTSRTFWRMKKIIERAMKQDRLVRKIMDIMDPKGKYHQ